MKGRDQYAVWARRYARAPNHLWSWLTCMHTVLRDKYQLPWCLSRSPNLDHFRLVDAVGSYATCAISCRFLQLRLNGNSGKRIRYPCSSSWPLFFLLLKGNKDNNRKTEVSPTEALSRGTVRPVCSMHCVRTLAWIIERRVICDIKFRGGAVLSFCLHAAVQHLPSRFHAWGGSEYSD